MNAGRGRFALAVVLPLSLLASGCSIVGGSDEPAAWFEPLFDDGIETLDDPRHEVCTADVVVLPQLHVIDQAVDHDCCESTARVRPRDEHRPFDRSPRSPASIAMSSPSPYPAGEPVCRSGTSIQRATAASAHASAGSSPL